MKVKLRTVWSSFQVVTHSSELRVSELSDRQTLEYKSEGSVSHSQAAEPQESVRVSSLHHSGNKNTMQSPGPKKVKSHCSWLLLQKSYQTRRRRLSHPLATRPQVVTHMVIVFITLLPNDSLVLHRLQLVQIWFSVWLSKLWVLPHGEICWEQQANVQHVTQCQKGVFHLSPSFSPSLCLYSLCPLLNSLLLLSCRKPSLRPVALFCSMNILFWNIPLRAPLPSIQLVSRWGLAKVLSGAKSALFDHFERSV